MTMRRIAITISVAAAMLVGSSAAAATEQPANPRSSCVALITSYEASQLAPVGAEVSGLASSPGLGSALVSPLARTHLGSISTCLQTER